MAILRTSINIPSGQVQQFRSLTRDVQVSVSEYYKETARTADPDTLATKVRACVNFIQVVNERLHALPRYNELFDTSVDPRAELMRAFEYARNVMQHVLHPVKPAPTALIGGLYSGIRTYAAWEEVPASVDGRLHKNTKPLKTHYDKYLRNAGVTDTFLDAARFFFEVSPDLIARDATGEWIGFPLRDQPGVSDRIHPEEPEAEDAAIAWLNNRRPGGDCRVIVGGLRDVGPESGVLCGYTFSGRCSFLPFFETPAQLRDDIAKGYAYYLSNIDVGLSDRAADFGFSERAVYCSEVDVEEWAGSPLDDAPTTVADLAAPEKGWTDLAKQDKLYPIRRARRLNADMPDYFRNW